MENSKRANDADGLNDHSGFGRGQWENAFHNDASSPPNDPYGTTGRVGSQKGVSIKLMAGLFIGTGAYVNGIYL